MAARRAGTGVGLAAAILASAGCVVPATQVLVVLDTDAPADRALTLRVRVAGRDDGGDGAGPTLIRGGEAGTIRLPGSFSIVPGPESPRDGSVTLHIDATLAPADPAGRPLTFRRTARFRFVPRESLQLRIFIATSCLSSATGCVRPGECTVSSRCDEQGLTCGDQGTCVPTRVMLEPRGDAAGFPPERGDVPPPPDARPDVTVDADASVPVDVPTPPVDGGCAVGTECAMTCVDTSTDVRHCGGCGIACPAVPNASPVCAAGSCGIACSGTFRDCDGVAMNGCESDTASSDAHCGACNVRCTGGSTCAGGACRCAGGGTDCGGVCQPTGAACSAGVGGCASAGTIVCDGTGTRCSAAAGAPQPETCNNVDDNCDGVVDEDPACVECLSMPFNVLVSSLTLTGGDREFSGNGPDVNLRVTFAAAGSQVEAMACVTMRETSPDFTAGSACRTVTSVGSTATPIVAMLDGDYAQYYRDTDHSCDFVPGGPGVASATCVGDTSGDDICVGSATCGSPTCSGCEVRFDCVRVRRRGF